MPTVVPRLGLTVAVRAFAAGAAAATAAGAARLRGSAWPHSVLRGDGFQEVKSHLGVCVAGGVYEISSIREISRS
jgi:hypothetical protein